MKRKIFKHLQFTLSWSLCLCSSVFSEFSDCCWLCGLFFVMVVLNFTGLGIIWIWSCHVPRNWNPQAFMRTGRVCRTCHTDPRCSKLTCPSLPVPSHTLYVIPKLNICLKLPAVLYLETMGEAHDRNPFWNPITLFRISLVPPALAHV